MLTKGQHQAYQVIKDFIAEEGVAPTISELAKILKIKSRSLIDRNLTALEEEGLIRRVAHRRRNICLVDHQNQLPIVGRIAAGKPIEAIPDEQALNIPELLLGPKRYLLKVMGDSMIGDNICDGDYVICERLETARDGDIVVALIDHQEATLKRLFRDEKNHQLILKPSNPTMPEIRYPPERIQIQGIFVGLLRLGSLHENR